MKKIFLRISVFVLIGLLITVFSGNIKTAQAELEQVDIRMDWSPYTNYIPFVYGKALYFYTDEGLDVNFIPGKGSSLSTKMVATNQQSIGIASAATTLIACSKGMPLQVVAALYQKSPVSVFFRKNSDIKTPKDLEGKSVASDPKSTKHTQFLAFLGKTGVDQNKVKLVSVSRGQEVKLFLAKETDCALQFSYLGIAALEKHGVDFDYFLFDDYGIHLITQSVITNKETIKNRPDLVRKFVRATIKSWKFAINHPEEAVAAFVKQYPEMDFKAELVKFRALIPLTKSEDTIENGFGYMSLKKWLETQNILFETGQIKTKVNVGDVFTNKFQ